MEDVKNGIYPLTGESPLDLPLDDYNDLSLSYS